MKKRILALLMACGMALSFTACGNQTDGNDNNSTANSANKTDKIVIGGIGPLTGPAASYGISVKQGAQIAVDEINASGGILGKQIEYLFEDDEHDAQKAINAYNRLMDKGMNVLMGTVTSNPCIAVADESVKDGILQLSPSGSAKDCTKNDNGFRICFTDPQQGEKMAEHILKETEYKNVAIIYDSADAYSTGIMEAFKATIEKDGGKVVASEAFVSGDKDFKAQLTNVKASNADCLFLPIYYQEVAYIADQAKAVGVELPYFGCDGWDGVIDQLKGDTALIDGSVFLTPFVATSEKEIVKKFVAAYQGKFNAAPDQFAADAYDAIYTIKAAVEKAGTIDNAKIIAAMTEITVEGTTGTMQFTKDGEPNKDAAFATIKDGKYIAQ